MNGLNPIIKPDRRQTAVEALVTHLGIPEANARTVVTPACLLDLPDHRVRGKKSMTRIQQIHKRRGR